MVLLALILMIVITMRQHRWDIPLEFSVVKVPIIVAFATIAEMNSPPMPPTLSRATRTRWRNCLQLGIGQMAPSYGHPKSIMFLSFISGMGIVDIFIAHIFLVVQKTILKFLLLSTVQIQLFQSVLYPVLKLSAFLGYISHLLMYPIDGYYSLTASLAISGEYIYNSSLSSFSEFYNAVDSSVLRYAGIAINDSRSIVGISRSYSFQYVSAKYYPIVYKIIPFTPEDVCNTYSTSTRPTSITSNYGIIGDNGQITQVSDNSSIVNETTNQFFNPATGESATISDWSYNYEDRSYTVTTETGDTVTVTYGDENITIVQGGDTYNIYYMVPGSGSDSPGPETCDHNWQETDKTEPTCVTAGKTISTYALCGKTKTDLIPAAGHTWVVDRTVQTVYDDDGNLLQQGYTIYQCSVCGEQYKDTQSTGPPGGTEEDKSLWEQLGDLIGSGIGGILELAGAILGKILDALTSLVEMITDKLKGIVEGILAIFDELPALFGGFLDFLGALFPYLPEEIMTLLTFGVIAIVFIGILKAVRR